MSNIKKNKDNGKNSIEAFKRVLKWIFILCLGAGLAIAYTYILNGRIEVETTVMFILLYAYMVFFLKFLIRLFR